jgi:hypothetical protein
MLNDFCAFESSDQEICVDKAVAQAIIAGKIVLSWKAISECRFQLVACQGNLFSPAAAAAALPVFPHPFR